VSRASNHEAEKTFRLNPQIASLLLFCAYLWVLKSILPDGINQSFSSVLLVWLCLSTAIALLISLRTSAHTKVSSEPASTAEKFPVADLILLALPLTPVVQFLLLNQASMDFVDNLGLISVSAVLLAVTVLIIPWLLNTWFSYPVSLVLTLSLTYTLANMATLARTNNWHLTGEFLPQAGLWLMALAVCGILYRIDKKALRGLTLCFLVATAGHTAWQGSSDSANEQPATHHSSQNQDDTSAWDLAFGDQQIRHTPHLFLMTYDGYVGNETLLQYGIDNSAQEQYLTDSGFQIYPGVYSVAAASRGTMSRVLGSNSTLEGVAGFSPMLQTLKSQGYKTMGIFKNDYFFNGVGVGYDESYPPPSRPSMALARAIVEGQFRHDVSFIDVPHSEFVRTKRRAIEAAADSPKFLYTHTGPGHSQNSGECRDDETALFRQRLTQANEEMRDDLTSILTRHPDALIIVNGDHGPFLTKNCTGLSKSQYGIEEVTPLDIQDRFGTFLAIRWPEARQHYPDDQLRVLQDVFPAIFAFLYERPMVDELRLKPAIDIPWNSAIGGVAVDSGVIVGGSYDGKDLYESSTLVQR
jgi:hypothetical protein